VATLLELSEIANNYRSDKGTLFGHAHGYTSLYSFLFEQFRNDRFSMLEIGLEQGGVEAGASADRETTGVPSINMWLEYFPNSTLFGFDISDFSKFTSDRFQFFRGDLSLVGDMERLKKSLPPLRIIVDDASHASFHQQLAFYMLFETVESGGYYVIEDFHWQPPFEHELPTCQKTIEVFEQFLNAKTLNIPFGDRFRLQDIANAIAEVYIHRSNKGGVSDWQTKMIALRKK